MTQATRHTNTSEIKKHNNIKDNIMTNTNIINQDLASLLQTEGSHIEIPEEATMKSMVKMPNFLTQRTIKATLVNTPNTNIGSTYVSVDLSNVPQTLSLEEQGEKALNFLVTNVQPYTKQDWVDAYKKIGFDIAGSKADASTTNVCLSSEIEDIASTHSWYITYNSSDSYIYNGNFWILLSQKQMQNFLQEVSIKMGIPLYTAKAVKFSKALHEQVLHSGMYLKNITQTNKVLLNMQNGTLEVNSNGINPRPFDHQDFLKHQLNFAYDDTAINQNWINFLNTVLPDHDTQKTLQQALGSLLIKGLNQEKAIFLYGSGANGKSVVFDVLHGIVGEDSISNYSLNNLTNENGYFRSKLKDKLINYASDIDLSKLNAGTFKTLASGEPIDARNPYKEAFILKNYAKLIFNLNDISTANIENTEGFFRRFLFIPFDTTIPKSKQDKKLAAKLLQNKAGILNWILEGTLEVIANESIYESQECEEFLSKFKKQPTSIEQFILSKGIIKDNNNMIKSSDLYAEYEQMCEELEIKPISQKKFSPKLEEKGFIKERKPDGVYWFVNYKK